MDVLTSGHLEQAHETCSKLWWEIHKEKDKITDRDGRYIRETEQDVLFVAGRILHRHMMKKVFDLPVYSGKETENVRSNEDS